jgi:hypothetical protein
MTQTTKIAKLSPNIHVLSDGSIDGNAYQFVHWKPGDKSACLDGDFDAEDLIAIGQHMRDVAIHVDAAYSALKRRKSYDR